MLGKQLEFEADQVICRQGDLSSDLYYLQSGKLLICTTIGTQVKALARISPGEFIGELSFFDGRPRAAHVVTLEKCKILQIAQAELESYLPNWFVECGINLTKKIRLLDEIVQTANLRRASSGDQKPLPIDEQRKLYKLLAK